MAQNACYIGIDLGTSGCRAYAIDQQQNILATADASLPASRQVNEHIVQNPAQWWNTCQTVLTQLLQKLEAHHVVAIAIDGTSGSVLICDKNGNALTDAYMYNDSACQAEAEIIKQVAPLNSGAHGASSGLAKCLSLKKQLHQNQVVCLNQADWIAGNFMQRFDSSDENNALKLGFDVVNRCWPDWMQALECVSILPQKIYPPGMEMGEINPAIAKKLKLPTSTKIVAGTTDSIAAFIATGCQQVGEAVTSLGSTLAIKLISDKPIYAPQYGVYSHRLGDQWLVGGASNTGGAVLKHYFSDEQIQIFSRQINPEKPLQLNYYPLLSAGERFPVSDPQKQPKLTPRPKSDVAFFQAMLEGMADIEKMAFDKLRELGAPYPTRIITMGGGSKNEAWRIIREKTCKIPVSNAEISEAAYGSALLALKPFQQ